MNKTFFIRAVCLAAILIMCFPTALGAGDSDNMVKLLGDTTVFKDPGLQEPYGVLSAGSVVYAGESVFSEGTAALEITFSHDRIIRTGYIPLMSGINTLTDAEAKEYEAKAPEGIMYRPGIILFDVSFISDDPFSVTDEIPSEYKPDKTPAEPDEVPAVPVEIPAEPPVEDPAVTEADSEPAPVPETSSEPADAAGLLPDDPSQGFAVEPEGPFAGGAAIPGFVKTLDTAAVFIDPALTRTMDELPAGAIVYADGSDPANGSVVIVFCIDYIIRTGYVPNAAVGPLTDDETAAYAEKAREGIVFRPGIVLLNTSSVNSTAPEQPDPSEVASLATPEAFAPAVTAEPTAAPNPPANSTPAPENTAAPKELFPANPEIGSTAPLPLNKRYLLNPEDPLRSGTVVSSVTLPVYTPGHAEGIIDFAVMDDGVLVVVSSISFSLDIKRSSERAVIPISYTTKYKSYVLLRFIPSKCTCEFAAKANRREQLVYFDECYSVFLYDPQMVEGYTISCSIN